ncbi:lachesin-like isoform X2 [Mya arenaria]|uniref:lachesin-like isoform X2 n=1 Tax=Mya arenaria TaxID=6604 RepID=UPI0022DF1183|nr:lachesin-like isoform X2 [Mya arenaria]
MWLGYGCGVNVHVSRWAGHVATTWWLGILVLCRTLCVLAEFPDTEYPSARYTPAPDFLPGPSNVTFHRGELAVLSCSVYNLGTKTVVWRRQEKSFPLTSGTMTVVADDRIQIGHVPHSNQWDLMIKNVQPEDAGLYECQVASTNKNFRRMVSLAVLDTDADATEIQITEQQYVERGDPIRLECNATGQYYTPDDIDWFRNGQRVTSDDKRGIKLLKQLSIAQKTFTSILNIERAQMKDSGVYVCRSSNKQIASTKVHVLNAETFNRKRGTLHEAREAEYDSSLQQLPSTGTTYRPSAAGIFTTCLALLTVIFQTIRR